MAVISIRKTGPCVNAEYVVPIQVHDKFKCVIDFSVAKMTIASQHPASSIPTVTASSTIAIGAKFTSYKELEAAIQESQDANFCQNTNLIPSMPTLPAF